VLAELNHYRREPRVRNIVGGYLSHKGIGIYTSSENPFPVDAGESMRSKRGGNGDERRFASFDLVGRG
jgi:hypothetical protein